MKYLSELTAETEIIDSSVIKEMPIDGLSQHSGKVKKNYIFFVSSSEAEKYIGNAILNGATVLVGEKMYPQAPCLVVKNVRRAVACFARAFYDYPDRKLNIVGVVGTNGKTTVTHMLRSIFTFAGYRTATIGTLGVFIGSDRYENEYTTPDSADLFRFLDMAVKQATEYVFIEISAHAIFFEKFYGVQCKLCVFTNFTQDHLDFFGTMERYREVKKSYFTASNMICAVVNTDEELGREINTEDKVCSVGYGLFNPGDIFAVDVRFENGTDFFVNAFNDVFPVHSPLYGDFNVHNLLAVIAVAKLFGIETETLQRGIVALEEIEGRFNIINWRSCKIVIDYAHTPDGMEKVLSCARRMSAGDIICVFGCGGDRDKSKRPLMGKIASELADVVVITSDNPRSEKPEDIIEDIRKGTTKEVFCVPDRREAVSLALRMSKPGDIVLLLGKGAEKYIESQGNKIPYSDGETCREYIGSHPCRA